MPLLKPGLMELDSGFAAAYPVVYRMSILFHPEMPFAFLCALAGVNGSSAVGVILSGGNIDLATLANILTPRR